MKITGREVVDEISNELMLLTELIELITVAGQVMVIAETEVVLSNNIPIIETN